MLPSLPGTYLSQDLLPSYAIFFLWIYCWLYPRSSLFVPGVLKFHCDIAWGGLISSIGLSTKWTLLIWKFLSLRLRKFFELFSLITLASPFYLVFYCLSSGAFIIWMLKLLELSSLLFAISFFFSFNLFTSSTSFTFFVCVSF